MSSIFSVSVVVPVYNAEKYLSEFMDSLIGQSLEHVQLICIDDGSTDMSYRILQQYQTEHQMTVLKNERNCGAANTRNIGLQLAEGEYVICLDCDDVLQKDYLKLLYEACLKYDADVAMGYIENFTYDVNKYQKSAFRSLHKNKIGTYPILEKPAQFSGLFRLLTNGPYDKMVRRKNIMENHIQFPDLPCTQDLPYSYNCILSANRVVFVENAQYFNRLAIESSITGRWKGKGLFFWTAMDSVWDFMQMHEMSEALSRSFFWKVIKESYCKCYDYEKDIRNKAVGIFKEYYVKWRMADHYTEHGISVLEEKLLDSVLQNNIKQDYIDILCEISFEDIKASIQQAHVKKEKIVLWGAGRNGNRFINSIQKYGGLVDGIIDNDTSKQGKYLGCTKIYSYGQIKSELSHIWVTSDSIYENIKEQVPEGIPIVNICSVMEQKALDLHCL